MGIDLIDQITPKNAGDFGMVQDTYLIGGWRVVADTTARDAIPTQRRTEGMRVRVLSTLATYELVGGVANTNWIEVAGGGPDSELTGNVTLAVTPTGDDTDPARPTRITSGDYSADPFLTIQAALDSLPRDLGDKERVIINVAAGNYAGFAVLGFTGGAGWYPGGDALRVVGETVTPTTASGPTSGTFTSATGKTAVLTAAGWTVDDLVGHRVRITAGAGVNQTFVIAANAADVITFAAKPGTPLNATSEFELLQPGVVIDSPDASGFFSVFIQGCAATIKLDGMAFTAGSYGVYAASSSYVQVVNCVAEGTYYGFSYQDIGRVYQQHIAALDNTFGIFLLNCTDGGNGSGDLFAKNSSSVGIQFQAVTACYHVGVYVRDAGGSAIRFIGAKGWMSDYTADGCGVAYRSWASAMEIYGLTDLSNCGTTFSVRMSDLYVGTVITGSGNTGWGLDVSAKPYARVWLGSVPTISGSLGEVTVDGTADITWANLTNVGDSAEGPNLSSIVRQ